MQSTTAAFNTAVTSNGERGSAFLEFEIIDADAATDGTITVTAENSFSKKDQTSNGIRLMSGKYLTFETDYFKLDGSFSLPPKSTESGYEVGWWSSALSGVGGTFSSSQVYTKTFTTNHSSIGITVTFDYNADEYASDFTIEVYDSSDVLIDSETVTGNMLSKYVWEQSLSNFRKAVITITKWASANRRARIGEIDYGIVKEYTDDDIIYMGILEELDTLNNQLSSNELKFTLNNLNKYFNILNPTGIYTYLQRKQKVKPYIGVYTGGTPEYVKMGTFYLTEWQSDEGTLTATFTARDILDVLDQSTFAGATYSSKTLKYIIDAIMTDAGVTDYEVDSALSSITVSGTLPEASHKVSLQTVAIAGQATIYSDRDGTLQIKQLTTTSSVFTIDLDYVYDQPLIKLNKLINTVNVKYGASTYQLVDSGKLSNEPTLAVTVDNPLIGTLSHAEDVADWILAEAKKRYLYEINWRQNPALEAGDIVTVEDDYSENKTMRVTKQEIIYQGYIGGKSCGKGDGT